MNAAANLLLTGPQTASIALGATLIAVVDYRLLLLAICAGMVTSAGVLSLRPAATTANAPVTAPAAGSIS